MNYMLSLIIFSPLFGILALSFIKREEERVLKWVGTFATLPPLFLSGLLLIKSMIEKEVSSFSEKWRWIHFGGGSDDVYSIYYELGIDGLSLAMIALTAVLTLFASLVSWHIKLEWKGYYLLILLLEIGMLGLFAAENMFLFFLFFEVTLIATFFLIGKWGLFAKEKAAFQFLIYNGLGSAVLLLVIGALFARTGTTNFATLEFIMNANEASAFVTEISDAAQWGLFIALLLAFGIKLPIVPFHKWMVHVHNEAHPAVVMLHSGILLKIGAYGLIRFSIGIFPAQWEAASSLIIILGLINILYGAFLALRQKDLRLVWAYSSVSHMGFVIVGLGVLNEAGVQGAIFQTISHGLISALLFLLVGVLSERYQTTTLKKLGGTAKTMPIFSGLLLLGGMASLGLPATSGFISEFTVLVGVFDRNAIMGSLAAIGLILTAVYVLRACLQITFGDLGVKVKEKHQPSAEEKLLRKTGYKLNVFEWAPAFLLVGLILGLGIFPQLLVEVIADTVARTTIGIGG